MKRSRRLSMRSCAGFAAHGTPARRAAAGALLTIGGYTLLLALTRRWHRRWGATKEEITRPLPGDELMRRASAHHAVTIHAPIEAVWPWLVQIGQDRAGFYSYTWLENLVLADIHNADRIHPEWQALKVGDRVRLASKRRYGDGPLLRVAAVEPPRHLVLERWGAFVLEPIDERTTRMIVRSHEGPMRLPLRVLSFFVFEPAHFIMERAMLRGIKRRAERAWAARRERPAAEPPLTQPEARVTGALAEAFV